MPDDKMSWLTRFANKVLAAPAAAKKSIIIFICLGNAALAYHAVNTGNAVHFPDLMLFFNILITVLLIAVIGWVIRSRSF